jgi:hypothetical protein
VCFFLQEFAKFSLDVRAARWREILKCLDVVCRLQKECFIQVKGVWAAGYNTNGADFAVGLVRDQKRFSGVNVLAQKLFEIFKEGGGTIEWIHLCNPARNDIRAEILSGEEPVEEWVKEWPPPMSVLREVCVESCQGKKEPGCSFLI